MRRYVRARLRRSGRRVFGGHRRMRSGSSRASSLRSRSPIGTWGEEDGWTEDNSPYDYAPFTATPSMTSHIPTTPLGFFHPFIPFELRITSASKWPKSQEYVWSGVNVQDIVQYLGIFMWMGIIGLPEMRMYWARNMTFSLSAFPPSYVQKTF